MKKVSKKYLFCIIFWGVVHASLLADSHTHRALDTPSLRSQQTESYTNAQLRLLGRLWVRHYLRSNQLYDNLFVQSYVRDLVRYLWQFSTLRTPGAPYVFTSLNHSINAFAVPGKVIGVHTGLLRQVENESQFASVLAHEIGHIEREHFVRKQTAGKQTSQQTLLYFLSGLALLLSGSADSGLALVAGSGAHMAGETLRYSRLHEQEADRVGLRILKVSHFNSYDFITMLELFKRGASLPDFLTYMQTHPLPTNRIADAERILLTDTRTHTRYVDSYNFLFAQSHVVLDAMDEVKKRVYCQELQAVTNDDLVVSFRLALCALAADDFALSARYFRQVHAALPRNHAVLVGYAQALQSAGEVQQAVALLQDAVQIQPKNFLLTMTLASVLLQQGRSIDALLLLELLIDEHHTSIAYWQLRARVYAAQGQFMSQQRALAQAAQYTGAFQRALLHLARAQRSADERGIVVPALTKEKERIEHLWKQHKSLFGK